MSSAQTLRSSATGVQRHVALDARQGRTQRCAPLPCSTRHSAPWPQSALLSQWVPGARGPSRAQRAPGSLPAPRPPRQLIPLGQVPSPRRQPQAPPSPRCSPTQRQRVRSRLQLPSLKECGSRVVPHQGGGGCDIPRTLRGANVVVHSSGPDRTGVAHAVALARRFATSGQRSASGHVPQHGRPLLSCGDRPEEVPQICTKVVRSALRDGNPDLRTATLLHAAASCVGKVDAALVVPRRDDVVVQARDVRPVRAGAGGVAGEASELVVVSSALVRRELDHYSSTNSAVCSSRDPRRSDGMCISASMSSRGGYSGAGTVAMNARRGTPSSRAPSVDEAAPSRRAVAGGLGRGDRTAAGQQLGRPRADDVDAVGARSAPRCTSRAAPDIRTLWRVSSRAQHIPSQGRGRCSARPGGQRLNRTSRRRRAQPCLTGTHRATGQALPTHICRRGPRALTTRSGAWLAAPSRRALRSPHLLRLPAAVQVPRAGQASSSPGSQRGSGGRAERSTARSGRCAADGQASLDRPGSGARPGSPGSASSHPQ